MLVNLKNILPRARRLGYAVGAFNMNNLEIAQAIIDAAQAERAPVILQTSEGAVKYAGMNELATIAHTLIKKASVPIAYHLDHGTNFDLVRKAIKSGYYSSVMIDASSLPFKENVKITCEIVKLAHKKNISVEAELGAIEGIEDMVSVEKRDATFTNPKQAKEFVSLTVCDALAVAIGTSHGAFKFKGAPNLDIERLKNIAIAIKIPLVLHGASAVPEKLKKACQKYGAELGDAQGVSDSLIRQAVKNGVAKVNIDTDIRIAFTVGVRKSLKEKPKNIDPRVILGEAKNFMTEIVKTKIKLLGSSGKA